MTKEEYVRLVNLYFEDIYRIAYSGCRNVQDAEDVTQETFFAMLQCKKIFESDAHVKYWLMRVAINKCKSIWRSPWKNRVSFADTELSPDTPPLEGSDEKLYAALRQLPPKYAQILHLYYFEELKIQEISSITGLSGTAVSTRLLRARQKLKLLLSSGETEEKGESYASGNLKG